MSMAHRVNAVRVQAKREFRSTMNGLGIYVVMSLIFVAISFWGFRSQLYDVIQEGIVPLQNPVLVPFYLAVGLAAAYLGLCAALSIARERDMGTIEVLFYGPIDSTSYVAGKYVQQMMAFLVVLLFSVVNFYVISAFTNLGVSNILGLLVLSLFLASCMVSFGIFLSSLSRRMAVSVILFLGLMLFFLAFQFIHSYLQSLTIFEQRDYSPMLIYVRAIFDNLNFIVNWISPLAYFDRGSLALLMGDTGQYVLSLASSTVYSLILLGLSVVAFNRKGVRR